MTDISFGSYAQAADDFVGRNKSDVWLANPAFHPLRAHPGLGWGEELITKSRVGRVTHLGRTWVAQLVLAGSRVRRPSMRLGQLPVSSFGTNTRSVMFVSHRLPGNRNGESGDIYFGSIPKSFRSVLLDIDHRPFLRRLFSRREVSASRMTLPSSLGWREEAKNLARTAVTIRQLIRQLGREQQFEHRRVLHLALLRSADMLANLRIARAVELAVQEVSPGVVSLTFEGHAWERLVIRASKRVSTDVPVLAYPHAGVFHDQHSIFRNLPGCPNPDGFLVPGSTSEAFLKERMPTVIIEVLGSPRRVSVESVGLGTRRTCLVLPEGLASEVKLLMSLSSKLAREHPEIDFMIRLHPAVAQERRLRDQLTSHDCPSNVLISDSPLEVDIANARWCLYRGSTAAVMAIAAGVIPLYFRQASEAVIDPLYSLWSTSTKPSHVVNSTCEIAAAFANSRANSEAIEAARLYFTEQDPVAITRMVSRLRNER